MEVQSSTLQAILLHTKIENIEHEWGLIVSIICNADEQNYTHQLAAYFSGARKSNNLNEKFESYIAYLKNSTLS